MSLTAENMTPADIAALSDRGGMFGGGDSGAWWIIILFLFVFMGGGLFGRNGTQENYTLASDFATLQRQIDSSTDRLAQQSNSIANGLCDGFYTQAQLVNGVNMNMANGFANAELSRANGQASLTNQIYGVQTALANCCCENRQAISGVNYNMATTSRDIIEAQNGNTRAILDAINAQTMATKDAKIAELSQKVNSLELATSQSIQNNYLISQLRPAPVPAFNVATPYCYGNSGGCSCMG